MIIRIKEELTQLTPVQSVGELQLELAQNVVQGILRDDKGNPIPNALLVIWGEPFYTDSFGVYTSPPLPGVETHEIIRVVEAPGFQPATITTVFSSGISVIQETTLSKLGVTNISPNIALYKDQDNKQFIQPGEKVKFWSVVWDSDPEDAGLVSIKWAIVNGSFQNVSDNLPTNYQGKFKKDFPGVNLNNAQISAIEFQAPQTEGQAMIGVEVSDKGGL
ncbi:hypothetical protein HYY75_03480, partial [bacterium]|nr:hypothetical protein [bacterium]